MSHVGNLQLFIGKIQIFIPANFLSLTHALTGCCCNKMFDTC